MAMITQSKSGQSERNSGKKRSFVLNLNLTTLKLNQLILTVGIPFHFVDENQDLSDRKPMPKNVSLKALHGIWPRLVEHLHRTVEWV